MTGWTVELERLVLKKFKKEKETLQKRFDESNKRSYPLAKLELRFEKSKLTKEQEEEDCQKFENSFGELIEALNGS